MLIGWTKCRGVKTTSKIINRPHRFANLCIFLDSLKRKAPEQESEEQPEEQEEVTANKKQKGGEGEKEGSEEQSNEAKEEREWFYIDDNKKEQGPFTLQEMKSWWFGGYMPATLTVRKADEKDFVSITTLSEFQQVPYTDPSAYYAYYYQNAMAASAAGATTAAATDTTAQAAYSGEQQIFPTYVFTPPVDKSEDDRIAAQLLCSDYSQTAAFNKRTGRFSSADGAWTDSAARQMAHYFDYEAWQRTCQENAAKKVKRVCPRHMWKQYRKKKKIPDYLRD